MKPNIILLVIDGLRSDQVYGNEKQTNTPNIDSLVKKGVFFKNAFSSTDGTNLTLNCIFNSLFPFKVDTCAKRIILKKNNIFEYLKKNNYATYGLVPEIRNFRSIIELFENEDNVYSYTNNTKSLNNGLTEQIISILESSHREKPGLFYFHLMDIHPDKDGKYLDEEDNLSQDELEDIGYLKKISSIDVNLGKIFSKIDFSQTLLVLCSDHGDRIPYGGIKNVDFEPELNKIKKIGGKILPKNLHNIGGKTLYKIRKISAEKKVKENEKKLTDYQSRSRESYFIQSLYDEILHVPILFVGDKIKPNIISDLVTHVDIFPTVCEYIGINKKDESDGRSLMPLMNNEGIDEIPIYLHTMPYQKPSPTDSVGIRTSKFKYFRSEVNSKKNIHLYDLEKDPFENHNIFAKNPELVSKFEDIITKFEEYEIKDMISDKDEEELVKEELKKLGYI